jgi:hypothetical protein
MDAASSGFHEPMSEEMRQLQRELRGTPVYVYDITLNKIVYMFDSKTLLKDSLGIKHNQLQAILEGDRLEPYLGRYTFLLTLDPDMSVDTMMTLDEFLANLQIVRAEFARNSDKMKPVYAQNMITPSLSKQYASLSACAKDLGGDRTIIRSYLNGKGAKPLYRDQ